MKEWIPASLGQPPKDSLVCVAVRNHHGDFAYFWGNGANYLGICAQASPEWQVYWREVFQAPSEENIYKVVLPQVEHIDEDVA